MKLKFSIFFWLIFILSWCTYVTGQAGRVGIGTTNPISKLSIDSGLNIDQANVNGFSLESALTFGNNRKVGIGSRRTVGANQAGLDFYTQGLRRMVIDSFGFVGIGTISPDRLLHVGGSTYSSSYIIAGAGIAAGLGNVTPSYDLHTVVGYFTTRVGIGTIPNSSYLLDIGAGSVRMQGAVRIEGTLNPNNPLTIGNNTTIEGSATIQGTTTIQGNTTITGNMIASGIVRSEGRGVVKGTGSSMQRMERMQIVLATGSSLAPGSWVNSAEYFYSNGSFSGTPIVLVGQLISSSGGEAAQVQFVPFSVNNQSFRIRVFNHGSNPVTLTATYEVLIIGPD
jgi:hypothetical protein